MFQKGYKQTAEHTRKITEANTGKKRSKETCLKISEGGKGRKLSEEHKRKIGLRSKGNAYCLGRKLTEEHKQKIRSYRHTDEAKRKISEASIKNGSIPPNYSGEEHWNWKGGITPDYVKIRNTLECKEWRKAVFKRDNWTCQDCGIRGSDLEAHHIKLFKDCEELRFDINNGKTLCVECHKNIRKKKIA